MPAPVDDALAFHRGAGRATRRRRVRELGDGVWLKDESDRLGLPAFKVLGVSWAVERALRSDPHVKTLVAASAGNHGRAVAHVAAQRGLHCRIFLPARSVPPAARRSRPRAPTWSSSTAPTRTRSRAPQRYAEGPYVVELADVGSSVVGARG